MLDQLIEINMKQHDFLATLVKNPDLTIDDLRDNDITPDNTSLLTKDEYKNNPNVVEAFKDDTGKFDENKFNNYYDNARILYANYANEQFVGNVVENFTFGPDAWFAPEDAIYRNDNPIIFLNKIPKANSQGISFITEEYDAGNNLSIRELGQKEKVYDYNTGEWLDWSPNDKAGLFKPIGLPTLVLAQWDEDGTHIEDGIEVQHKAGDIKLNYNGRPYYETLGDREIYNKDILRNSDILTVDGSKWNKLDFFDSDDIKKSIPKTIANVIAIVAPMFIPGVGEIYGYFGAADGLIRVAPVLLKSINGLLGGSDNELGKKLNNIEGYLSRFDSTSSDYAREHLASIEGVGNLVTDISRQLFEQKAVSTLPVILAKARKSNNIKNIAENSKKLALGYMAMTSAQDVYGDFKQAGANDLVAGLGTIASMLALYRLMNIDYFRDNILKDTFMDESDIRAALRGAARESVTKLKPVSVIPGKKEAATFTKKFSDFYQDTLLKSIQGKGLSGLVARGFSEGTEETMEELTTDIIKGVTEGLNALGIPVTSKNQNLDFGWSAEDIATRYGTAFAGGFLGGMIFAGQSRYEKWLNNKLHNLDNIDPTDRQRLIYYLAQGKRSEIDEYLNRWYQKGVLGNKNLSIDGEVMSSLDGKSEFIPSTSGIDQNEAVYRSLKGFLDSMQQAIESEIPDGRYLTGEGLAQLRTLGYTDVVDNPRLITASAISALGDYASFDNDLYKVLDQIITTKSELSAEVDKLSSEKTPATEEERKAQSDSIKNNSRIKELQERLKKLREEKDAFFSGAKNKYYAGQALFAANEGLHQSFVNLDKNTYVKLKYGLSYDSFNDEDKTKIDDDYNMYNSKEGRENIYRAYDLYLKLSTNFADVIQKHAEDLDKQLSQDRPLILGIAEFVNAQKEYDRFAKEYSELEAVDLDSRTEDQNNRMTELRVKLEAIHESMEKIKDNPILSIITSDEVANQFFTATGIDNKTRIYHDSTVSGNSSVIATNILNILREIYKNDISTGNYRFDDSELQALLQGIAGSYKREGGAETRWTEYDSNILSIKYDGDIDIIDSIEKDPSNPILFGNNEDFKNSVIRIADNFVKNIGINNAVAMQYYNELLNLLRENTNLLEAGNKEYLNDFLTYILPTIDNKTVPEILTEFDGYRSKIHYSAFLDLAAKLGTDVKDTNLLNLVQQELLNLSTQPNLFDYLIKNKAIASSLKSDSIKTTLDIVTAVIQGAYDGTNDIMNNFKDTSTDNNDTSIPTLATMSDKAGKELLFQGEELRSRIAFLSGLSETNEKRSLLTHKNTAINMRPKWIKAMLSLSDSFEKEFGFSLQDLWDTTTNNLSLDVNEGNYISFEQAAIKFESALYDKIHDLYNTTNDITTNLTVIKEISDKLLNLFNKGNLFKSIATKITDDKNSTISDVDLLYHFATLFSIRSNEFYSTYKTIQASNIAPVYGQEYAIHQIIGQICNPGLFNTLLDEIQDNVSESELKKETKDWIKSKVRLYNTGIILGSAGSGKTVGVIKKILSILTNNSTTDIKFVSKEFSQAKKAMESAGFNTGAMSTDEYFTKVFGEIVSGYKLQNNHFTATSSDRSKKSVFDKSSDIKILVIDEVEMLSEPELDRLSDDARDNNIFILGLGDLKQPGADLSDGEKQHSSGLEDCAFVRTPTLTTSMRAQTVAQVDNTNLLSNALETVLDKVQEDPNISLGNRDTIVVEELKSPKLYYYENPNNGEVIGTMSVKTTDQIVSKLDQLSKLSGKVLVITDNVGTYEKYKSDKVEVISYEKRAGVEADYVIVDVDLKSHNSRDNKISNYLLTRDFYTLTQRATKGTIIKVSDDINLFSFVGDETKAADVSIDETAIKEFTEWRLRSLDEIKEKSDSLQETIKNSPLVKGYDDTLKDKSEITETFEETTPETTQEPEIIKPELIEPEPSIPASITQVEHEPSNEDNESEIPEPIIESPVEIPTTKNLVESLLGLSDNKIESASEFVKALSKVFPYARLEISKEIVNSSGNIDDLLHNTSVIRNIRNVISKYYGESGLDILNIILNNPDGLPEQVALDIQDQINNLKLKLSGISNNGIKKINKELSDSEIVSSLSKLNDILSDDRFFELKPVKDILSYKDIRSVLPPASRNIKTEDLRKIISTIGSYVRTGKFTNITDVNYELGLIKRRLGNFEKGSTEMWVIPYNDSGLLVSRHYNEDKSDYFDIPLLIVNSNKFGRFTGSIQLLSQCSLSRTQERQTLSDIGAQGIYFSPIAGVINKEGGNLSDVDDRTVIYLDDNDGKPMIAYTDEIALKQELLDSGERSVFVTDNEKSIKFYDYLRIMGIQCRSTLSELLTLIDNYKQTINLVSDESPRIINATTNGNKEINVPAESQILVNGSLLRNSKGEIKQLLPEFRCGRLLTLACTNVQTSALKLTGILNSLQSSSKYEQLYVLTLSDKNTTYSIANVNGNYVVGNYDVATHSFVADPLVSINISSKGIIDLNSIIDKLFGKEVLPSMHLSYYSYNKSNNKLFKSKVSFNWELATLLSEMTNDELNKFNDILSNHPQFKYGIYLDDSTVKETVKSNSYYGILDMTGRIYDSDRTLVNHSQYVIDTNDIEPYETNEQPRVTLQDFIKNNNLNIDANTVEEANQLLMNNSNTWIYNQIIETDSGYELRQTDDSNFANWVRSKYKINISDEDADSIVKSDKKGFYVTDSAIIYFDDRSNLFIESPDWRSNPVVDAIKSLASWNDELANKYLANKLFGIQIDESLIFERMESDLEFLDRITNFDEIWDQC